MASVDDRVVRMEFDNAAFERKVDSTIQSLGNLDKAMQFDGARQGLSGVSDAIGRFNLGSIGDAVLGIASKFEALGVIGITVLSNITNKAIDAGLQLAKSLSLDQIISGFKEYELNMSSIQTILSNTKADGTNLEDVNSALDTLNEYADKTIYNFGQMTKNIGTFTAAGVDLDTSVMSIKGISNLAAISGSSAEQASTAMYQLSQAVSTGTLKLMDWNSVVNAGMGGEVFQKALFETGKMMQTIEGVPMDQTFEEWTDAGNSFRSSLQDGWLTSEVLTTTLQGFTGEMTEAQLTAIGYTKEQAAEIMELGKTGVEAATKVRTLTGLIQTTKESIGSGWSESFRIVFGNFEEATELFSGISASISDMVSNSADARNELLQGWKDLGGRTLLIESVKNVMKNLGEIIAPIKEAFHEIFPPMTAERLMAMTEAFSNFADALKPSEETVDNLKRIFEGLFSALRIGWEVITETARFIADLFTTVTGAGSGGFLELAGGVGDFITELKEVLVDGGGIKDFFTTLRDAIKDPIPALLELKDKIVEFFENLNTDSLDGVGDAFGRFGSRFESLKELLKKAGEIWEPFWEALQKVAGWLDTAWEAIKTWFSELGSKIAAVMGPGDFDAAVDALNVGLLGGIAALLAKFIKDGFNFDIGSGFFEKVGQSFEELTGVLSAMQTNIKAEALLKIAAAVGILTASVLVLSLIDSVALTKALTAMAIGFGQLMGAFAILTKISLGPSSAASFAILSTGMIMLSSAILILSLAAKTMATLNWEELSRGLTGVLALMTIMTTAAIILSQNTGGLIRAGIGMMAIAVAMNILVGAVKMFSMMSWGDMAQGFVGVAGGLLIIAGALQLMPNGASLALQGIGLMAIATSMAILAGAIKLFAVMDWGELGKGFAAMAGGLLIIAGAMQLMPTTMPIIGAGLLLVSISLIAIAKAMEMMSGLSWSEIGRGLAAMAGSLLILAVACHAMSGALLGAVAIGVVSASLLLLAKVLQEFSSLSWKDLLRGLVGIAAALATLAIAAMLIQPALPAMLGLGAALLLIGAGFALFGLGASMVAEAFERLADAGKAGSEALVASLEAIGAALPALVKGFAEGLIELLKVFLDFAPVLVKALVEIIGHVIEGLTKLIPQATELIGTLITSILELIVTKYPEFIEAGISLITSLLAGIRDNIGEVVTLVGEIIVEFLDALSVEVPRIIESVANLVEEIFIGAAAAVGHVAGTLMFGIGIVFLQGFMDGITDALPGPMGWFTNLASTVIGWIGDVASTLWNKGVDFITGLLGGITGKMVEVINFFGGLAGAILGWIGDVIGSLWGKGVDLITGLLNGISEKIVDVSTFFTGLIGSVLGWVGDTAASLWEKGSSLIAGLLDGIEAGWTSVSTWLGDLGENIVSAVGDISDVLYDIGKSIFTGLFDGMKSVWNTSKDWLGSIGGAITDLKGPPKKDAELLVNNGKLIMQGLQKGMDAEWDNVSTWLGSLDPAEYLKPNDSDYKGKFLNGAIAKWAKELHSNSFEFDPTITPVLDLTRIAQDAGKISDYIQDAEKLTPSYSFDQARTISASTNAIQDDADSAQFASTEVKFEQNIYAPRQLTTSDIYKNTRNQITMAKKELNIP
ncbi:MAG: tape measure protein [Paenisporosarcina sp.]